jgi:peptide/nickel transport system substrate-binding protein
MRKKQWILVWLTVLSLVIVSVACGPTEVPPTKEPAEPEATSPPEATAPPAEGEVVELVYQNWTARDEEMPWEKELIAKFEEGHPNIKIKLSIGPYAQWGHTYGLPWRYGVSSMFINEKMFEDAGIPIPDGETWTWNDMLDIAKKLTDADKDQYGFAYSGTKDSFGTSWEWMGHLFANGGGLIDENGAVLINNDAAVESLTWWTDLLTKEGVVPPETATLDEGAIVDMLGRGQVAMWNNGPWYINNFRNSYPDTEFTTVPLPKGKQDGASAGGTLLAISPLTEHPDEAWEFIKFMTSDEILREWSTRGYFMPTRGDVLNEEIFQEPPMLAFSQSALRPNSRILGQYPEVPTLFQGLHGHMQEAFLELKSPKEALDATAEEWATILEPYYGEAAKPAEPKAEGEVSAGELVYAERALINQLDSIDPRGYPSSYEVVYLLYDQLVRFDENLQIQPELAKSWEVSDDGLTWTLHLRDDVKFHDGTPFNAEAVKFHVERLQDPDWASPNASLWDHIVSVEVADDYTVKLSTAEPFGPMLFYMAHGSGGIASPAAVDEWGKDFVEHPVGSGPYELESFTPGVEVVLIRNEDHWGDRPPLDKITVKQVPEAGARVAMLETGEAHIIAEVPPEDVERLNADPNIDVVQQTGLRAFFIAFNFDIPALQDVKVRQALNYAVDTDTIVDAIFLGLADPLDSPAPSAMPGHVSAGQYEYDPDKASALLADAGWTDTDGDGIVDKDGEPLKLTILFSNAYPKEQEVIEAVQQYMKDVGVDLELWQTDSASVRSYQKVAQDEAQYDLVNWAFNASNGDITYHLESMWVSNPDVAAPPYRWNLGWYSNPELDELLASTKLGEAAVDPEQRAQLLTQAQETVWNEATHLWLYTPHLLAGRRTDIKGLLVLPTIFYNLRNARFAE